MSKKKHKDPDLLDHYDFSDGVRGKYVERALKSSHVIVLEPDVAEAFPTSEAVNRTLRSLLSTIRKQSEITR